MEASEGDTDVHLGFSQVQLPTTAHTKQTGESARDDTGFLQIVSTPSPMESSTASGTPSTPSPLISSEIISEGPFLRPAPAPCFPPPGDVMLPPPSSNLTIYLQCPHLTFAVPVLLLKAWIVHNEVALIVQRIRLALGPHPDAPVPDHFALAQAGDPQPAATPFSALEHRGTYVLVPSETPPTIGLDDLEYCTLPKPRTKMERALPEAECMRLWIQLKALNQPDKASSKASMKALREFLLVRLGTRHDEHLASLMLRFGARHHDPEALVHLGMVLSDVVYRHCRSDGLPADRFFDAIPHIFAAIHSKVGLQWRRMLSQVVDVWDSRPGDFPSDLRFETRMEILLHGGDNTASEGARVQFAVPPEFVAAERLEGRLVAQWSEVLCRQFGYVESHTCDNTSSAPLVTVRYDRLASGVRLHRFLRQSRSHSPAYVFESTLQVVPGPVIPNALDASSCAPITNFPPVAAVIGDSLEWGSSVIAQNRGSPAESARRTPVRFTRAATLRWATAVDGDRELGCGTLVPLGPNVAVVGSSIFAAASQGSSLFPHRAHPTPASSWTALRLRCPTAATASGDRLIPRDAVRLVPIIGTSSPMAGRGEMALATLLWFEQDIFADNYFLLYAETPRPLDTLTFLAFHTAPDLEFVSQTLYPLYSSRFRQKIPEPDSHKGAARDVDQLPAALRAAAVAQLQQLRDELISSVRRVAGPWVGPTLLACPTRWVYLPDDDATFGASVTFAAGAQGGVLVPHAMLSADCVAGIFLGHPAPGEGTSRFYDPHSPCFVVIAVCWLWPSLCQRPSERPVTAFLRYLERHSTQALQFLEGTVDWHKTPLARTEQLRVIQMCRRLEEGVTAERLAVAVLSREDLDHLRTENESLSPSGTQGAMATPDVFDDFEKRSNKHEKSTKQKKRSASHHRRTEKKKKRKRSR